MEALIRTDILHQKENLSHVHMKVLCREKNVWKDVIGRLDTGTDHNWIGIPFLDRIGPQPRSKIPEEFYGDFQNQTFSVAETVRLCWHVANSDKLNEEEFRIIGGGAFDILLGRLFIESRNILERNEKALLFYHKRPSEGVTYYLTTIHYHTKKMYARGKDANAANELHATA